MVANAITIEKDKPVVMRDGTTLYADIYRPKDEHEYPILIMRTPYNKEDAQSMNYAHPSWYAKHGFVVIVQDTRGRWSSEGDFHPLIHEGEDGYDTIEWAVKLPNTIPKVGLYGFSYVGLSQLITAATKSPHLTCIAPFMCGSTELQSNENGAFALAQNLTWALFISKDIAIRNGDLKLLREISTVSVQELYNYLPLPEVPVINKDLVPFYEKWLRGERNNLSSGHDLYKNIHVPALHVGGWYDIYIDKTIENFIGIKERSSSPLAQDNQFLYLTPWFHMPWSRYVGELDFGKEAENRIDYLQLRWFNKWLKEDEKAWIDPPVQYFLMGENRWIQSNQWPPKETRELKLYLKSEGKANSINGDGTLSTDFPNGGHDEDVYMYHPSIPVPAIGGRSGPDPVLTPMGPKNQIPIEIRNDILVFTSEVLEEDITVSGEIKIILYAATTVEDADFVVKLIDVYPDGRAFNIAEGILRASSRSPSKAPSPVIPGEIIRYEIKAGSVANVFRKGHAIRVDITSSLFPTFDRHPNQFLSSGEVSEASFKSATQTIYHNELYPSHLILPIINYKDFLLDG